MEIYTHLLVSLALHRALKDKNRAINFVVLFLFAPLHQILAGQTKDFSFICPHAHTHSQKLKYKQEIPSLKA